MARSPVSNRRRCGTLSIRDKESQSRTEYFRVGHEFARSPADVRGLASYGSSSRLGGAENRWLAEPRARPEESVRTARAGETKRDPQASATATALGCACAPRAFLLPVRLPPASLSVRKNRQRWRGTLWRRRTRRPPSRRPASGSAAPP